MSVPEGQRKSGKLEVLVKALDVANHTNKLLSNQKKFDPKFDYVLGDDIKRTARDIYRHCWGANNIRAINKETWQARKRLQQQACLDCNELLILIDMAYGTYHLASSKVEFGVASRLKQEKKSKRGGTQTKRDISTTKIRSVGGRLIFQQRLVAFR